MKKHTECKDKTLKVTGIENVPAPDAEERLSRAIDILLKAAARDTEEPPRQSPAEDAPSGDEGSESHE